MVKAARLSGLKYVGKGIRKASVPNCFRVHLKTSWLIRKRCSYVQSFIALSIQVSAHVPARDHATPELAGAAIMKVVSRHKRAQELLKGIQQRNATSRGV